MIMLHHIIIANGRKDEIIKSTYTIIFIVIKIQNEVGIEEQDPITVL